MSTVNINIFAHAKKIYRKGEETWQDAIKRAAVEVAKMKAEMGYVPQPKKTYRSAKSRSSTCYGKAQTQCAEPCHWIPQSKPYKTKTGKTAQRKAHCGTKGYRTAGTMAQAWEKTFM
jgi:hypothetical protein